MATSTFVVQTGERQQDGRAGWPFEMLSTLRTIVWARALSTFGSQSRFAENAGAFHVSRLGVTTRKEDVMPARIVLAGFLCSLAVSGIGSAKAQAGQSGPQTPSEVARVLTDQKQVLVLPVKGKAKRSIDKGSLTFVLPDGANTVLLLELPAYEASYAMTIKSYRRGLGRTTEVFVPSGVLLDADLQQAGAFGEDRLVAREEHFAAVIRVDETNRGTRYVLLFTRGNLVGQRMGMRGDLGLVSSGLFRLERSLEAKIEVEIKPDAPNKGT